MNKQLYKLIISQKQDYETGENEDVIAEYIFYSTDDIMSSKYNSYLKYIAIRLGYNESFDNCEVTLSKVEPEKHILFIDKVTRADLLQCIQAYFSRKSDEMLLKYCIRKHMIPPITELYGDKF